MDAQSRPQFLMTTAAQVADAFVYRIAEGAYASGELLPSCRDVARDLHVDKNTVHKAYRMLQERGIVHSVPGKGVIVHSAGSAGQRAGSMQERVESLMWTAKAFGVGEDDLWRLVGEAIGKIYGGTLVKVGLVECCEYDAQHLAQQIADRLNIGVQTILLSDFVAAPQRYFDDFDIVATTFSHFAAVGECAGPDRDKIVAVRNTPMLGDAIRIARFPRGTRFAAVCTAEPTISLLTGLIRTYNSEAEVYGCMATDAGALARTLSQVDVIVDTVTSHDLVLALSPQAPVMTVSFVLDDQSVAFLKNRVMEITRARVVRPDAMVSELPDVAACPSKHHVGQLA